MDLKIREIYETSSWERKMSFFGRIICHLKSKTDYHFADFPVSERKTTAKWVTMKKEFKKSFVVLV